MNSQANVLTVEELQQEYEEFLYTVSHDLKAPVRHIREFTKLLIQSRDEQNLSDDEKEWVGFLNDSLDQLSDMQAALLDLSRIATQGRPFEVLKGEDIRRFILQFLHDKVESNEVKINVETLPDCYADGRQIQRVFACLIQNCLTFHKPDQIPEILISGYEDNGLKIYEVTDKGIGIEPKYQKDVFNLFRKINKPGEYPGIGAGLSIAKKIVERHKGEIWIRPEIKDGVSVMFSIPDQ